MSFKPTDTVSPSFLDRWFLKSGKAVCVIVFIVVLFFGQWLLIAIPTPVTAAQVLGPFLMVLIAGIACYIAWQQKETAEYKVKLDLFDRRYRVYRGLMDLLAAVVREENISPEVMGKFYCETDTKRFLFGDDINDYLKEVHEKVVNVRLLRRRIEPHPNITEEQRGKAIEKENELVSWLDERITEAATKFDRYMSFKKL
jgi:hypothetical protein